MNPTDADPDGTDALLEEEVPKATWGRTALRLLRDLGAAAAFFLLVSTALGWLRAPDLPAEAPPFVLSDLQGQTVSLEELRGQTVVLNFWATWCGPCRVEIPAFSSFANRNPDIPVLGIAVDGSVPHLLRAKEELGIDYPVLVADRDVVRAYGAHTLPTTVVVGPDGEVQSVHVGVMTPPQLWWATW